MAAMSDIKLCPGCGRKTRVPAAATGRPRCPSCKAWLPWLVAATETDFDRVAIEAPLPVLVDLWAPWCGPCRTIAPAIDQIAAEQAGRVKVVKVNVDEAPGIAARYAVQGVPTLLLLDRGRERARQVGALPGPALSAWVQQAIPSGSAST